MLEVPRLARASRSSSSAPGESITKPKGAMYSYGIYIGAFKGVPTSLITLGSLYVP